jgi:hypothetical protein
VRGTYVTTARSWSRYSTLSTTADIIDAWTRCQAHRSTGGAQHRSASCRNGAFTQGEGIPDVRRETGRAGESGRIPGENCFVVQTAFPTGLSAWDRAQRYPPWKAPWSL